MGPSFYVVNGVFVRFSCAASINIRSTRIVSVELFLQYSGDKNITANLKISQGNAVLVKSKRVVFDF
jgi:hypothetical protein